MGRVRDEPVVPRSLLVVQHCRQQSKQVVLECRRSNIEADVARKQERGGSEKGSEGW
jgi:hypothetical protein